MKYIWQVEPDDINKVQTFLNLHRNNPFVRRRIERNLRETKPKVTKLDPNQV